MSESCEYCGVSGVRRAGKEDGLDKDVFVCDRCWKLLKDPKTALPLLRGHLAMQLKGSVSPAKLDWMMNKYMGIVADWKAKVKN
jgi:hypothetical protein